MNDEQTKWRETVQQRIAALRERHREEIAAQEIEKSAFANRMMAESAAEYAEHALHYWPDVPKMEQAIESAPAKLVPSIKRIIAQARRAA